MECEVCVTDEEIADARPVCATLEGMKIYVLALVSCFMFSSCSLVTVPVKTAGSVANTTVKTTGKVLTAPFKGRAE